MAQTRPPSNVNGKDPPTPSERTKAARLRMQVKASKPLSLDDAAWLEQYEAGQTARAEAVGASQTRRVEYSEEETQAIGTGEAAVAAAGIAAATREEGRRLDSMLTVAIGAMGRAFDMSMRMCDLMANRNEKLENAHVRMMEAMRGHYLARVEAEGEADALAKQLEAGEEGDKDGISKLAEQLLPFLLPGLESAGLEIPRKEGK
jgi:hypothetical protein